MKAIKPLISAAAVGLGLALATPAHAQARVDTVTYTGPDRGLLKSGVWTLGLSYVPALIVGIESSVPADRYLLAPVAGPWIDFAKRDCTTCSHETTNKVLLATDGIVQGIGALEIVGSFLFVERTTVSTARNAWKSGDFSVRLVPQRRAGGYGMAAVGTF